MLSKISQQHKISNQCPSQTLMQPSKQRTSIIRFVQVRKCCKSCKDKTNSSYSSKFIWNASKDSVDPLEVPFWYNVGRCRIGVCRDIIVRVSQPFRMKVYQKSSSQPLRLRSYLIFGIKVRVKVHQICLSINSQRICRTILM